MHWTDPTPDQLDKATAFGIEYALDEINAGYRTEPQDAPLSGEWADGPLPKDVAAKVGYLENLSAHGETYADGVAHLGDSWEHGYAETWRVYLDNIQHPHVPYPGEPKLTDHDHDWADGRCQHPDCAATRED